MLIAEYTTQALILGVTRGPMRQHRVRPERAVAGVEVEHQHVARTGELVGDNVGQDPIRLLGAVAAEVQPVGVRVLPFAHRRLHPRIPMLVDQRPSELEQ